MNLHGCMTGLLVALAAVLVGCSDSSEDWPPEPKNQQERDMIESALRAVAQFDHWEKTACVVEHKGGHWRVQAWRIVHPEARGRDQCVPWGVRGITLDDDGKVISYENHL